MSLISEDTRVLGLRWAVYQWRYGCADDPSPWSFVLDDVAWLSTRQETTDRKISALERCKDW